MRKSKSGGKGDGELSEVTSANSTYLETKITMFFSSSRKAKKILEDSI